MSRSILTTVRLNPQSRRPCREHSRGKAISHDWQQVIHDPRLQQVVTIALNSNRDVQKAIADIDSARALYGQTNASLFPTVNAALSSTRSRSLANGTGTTAEADGTVSSYTLDLFGRNQSLSRAARETRLPVNLQPRTLV